MNSSASRSSSAVVAPGRTWSPSNASVSATIAPAAAIWSSSWADFRTIMRDSRPAPTPPAPPRKPVDRPIGVDTDEVTPQPVVTDERLRLLVVEGQPLVDSLRRVVGAPLELRAAEQALASNVVGKLELEDDRKVPSDLVQHRVERV